MPHPDDTQHPLIEELSSLMSLAEDTFQLRSTGGIVLSETPADIGAILEKNTLFRSIPQFINFARHNASVPMDLHLDLEESVDKLERAYQSLSRRDAAFNQHLLNFVAALHTITEILNDRNNETLNLFHAEIHKAKTHSHTANILSSLKQDEQARKSQLLDKLFVLAKTLSNLPADIHGHEHSDKNKRLEVLQLPENMQILREAKAVHIDLDAPGSILSLLSPENQNVVRRELNVIRQPLPLEAEVNLDADSVTVTRTLAKSAKLVTLPPEPEMQVELVIDTAKMEESRKKLAAIDKASAPVEQANHMVKLLEKMKGDHPQAEKMILQLSQGIKEVEKFTEMNAKIHQRKELGHHRDQLSTAINLRAVHEHAFQAYQKKHPIKTWLRQTLGSKFTDRGFSEKYEKLENNFLSAKAEQNTFQKRWDEGNKKSGDQHKATQRYLTTASNKLMTLCQTTRQSIETHLSPPSSPMAGLSHQPSLPPENNSDTADRKFRR